MHQCNRANTIKDIYGNNIAALNDSISYYKAKNGSMVATKTLLLGDIKTLKAANKELEERIKNMGVKDPNSVVYVETVIDNLVHDTVWNNILFDTSFSRGFAFNNDYRILEGNVWYDKTNLGMSITNDKVICDYTIAVKDNKVYVVSSNPYVQYNNIEGISLPRYKPTWTLNIGPSVSLGYSPSKQWVPTVGVSMTFGYNIMSFGKKY